MKTKQLQEYQKRSMINDFHSFTVDNFGNEIWEQILSMKILSRDVGDLINEYQDYLFHNLVNLLSQITKISIKTLLSEFSDYR